MFNNGFPLLKNEEKEEHLTVPDSKPINEIGYITGTSIDVEYNNIKKQGKFTTEEGVEIILNELTKKTFRLPISADKILTASLSELIKVNDPIQVLKNDKLVYEINIPLMDYALACGKDVIEHETDTPEAQLKEKNRVKNLLKKLKKDISSDLLTLMKMTLAWSEKRKGQSKDYKAMSVVIGYEVKGGKSGNIKVRFDPEFIKYIVQTPLNHYPKQLLAIDGRDDNTYKVGKKLSSNYYKDCNRTQKQNPNKYKILKVKTLLKVTTLPDIEEANKHSGWIVRIKEPLEEILNTLYKTGAIKDWRYSGVKGVQLTDTEADFTSFSKWANTNIYYEMYENEEDQERLEANKEKAQKRAKRAKKKQSITDKKIAELKAERIVNNEQPVEENKTSELTGAEKLQAKIQAKKNQE